MYRFLEMTMKLVKDPDLGIADPVPADLGIANPVPGVSTLGQLVSKGLAVVIPIAGILFLVMTVYAGITYTMSAGDPGKVKSAQAMLTNSIIGLVITIFAFAIRAIVMNILTI